MGSLNSLAGSITFSLFSFLLGAFADRIGVIPALITAALLAIIPMVIYWYVLRPSTDEHTSTYGSPSNVL